RTNPERALAELQREAEAEPFAAVFIDTLAAMFDGSDANDNVQAGGFLRRLRPMTRVPGRPTVLVAAHPIKNATKEQLLPYDGGAIQNEADETLPLGTAGEKSPIPFPCRAKFGAFD